MTDKGHPPPIGISRTVKQAYSHTGDNPYIGVGLGTGNHRESGYTGVQNIVSGTVQICSPIL